MKKVVAKYGVEFRCQKVQHLEGLLNHLQQEPWILLGCNNLSLCASLSKTKAKNPFCAAAERPDLDSDEHDTVAKTAEDDGNFIMDMLKFKKQQPIPAMSTIIDNLASKTSEIDNMRGSTDILPQETKQLKETHTAKNVELVKSLMKKYNKVNEEELLNEIMKTEDPQDLVNYRVLFTEPYIKTIMQQAIAEMRIENYFSGYTYLHKFIEECPSPVDCLSVEDTAQLHLYWCSDQGIDAGDFMMKLYCILNKSYAKINCFMMQGQSNAGKTYWTPPLMVFPDIIGQTIQSQDFAYQRCLNTDFWRTPNNC